MNRLFLLGLSVLYLSKDGESEFGFMKEYDKAEGIACNVCKRFVKGHCLESEDSCLLHQLSGCETKMFFVMKNNVRQDVYATLNCNSHCEETEGTAKGMKFKISCCNKDYCNKP